MKVNDELLDRQVRHQVNLQRYSAREVRQVIKLLYSSERDVARILNGRLSSIQERGFDIGPTTTKRLKELEKRLHLSRSGAYKGVQDLLSADMADFSSVESEFQLSMLETVIPVRIDLIEPSAQRLVSIATKRPFQGRLLKEWVKDLEVNDRKAVSQSLKIGLAEGETTAQITSRIVDRLKISRRHAETITRTAIAHVADQARTEVGLANSDIIKAEKWLATLDGRTTPICQARDGQTYKLGKAPPIPAHHQCRSTKVLITKSWKELGIKLDDAPPGTRSSMGGEVPMELTYNDWLKNQPHSFQDEVLGNTKASLFREGGLTVDKFVDRSGKTYTLDQLRRKNPAAWKKTH